MVIPQTIEFEGDRPEITCPYCNTQVSVFIDNKGKPHEVISLGFHKMRFYLSKTQFIEGDCPLNGSTIQSEDEAH